ncbi:MAG: helix-turn-helix transcriptional regulator [Clostridiales bacterium]|nr:helix-turn-helix transcriptional regulator [Clostridiales bacterium]
MVYKIKELRKEKGLTQEELAEKAGVSRAILSGLESGRIEVTTTRTLMRIAKALNCDVTDIFLDAPFNRLNELTPSDHHNGQ